MELDEVPYQFLQEITNGFSEDRKLGEGAFGAVYRGVIKNGNQIAVKILHDNVEHGNQQFRDEFHHLRMLKHPNIVQVLGYCYETKKKPLHYNGRTVLAETTYKALCFEYLRNGGLQQHISDDEFHGLDWHTRYNIIKGTCEGLHYIHEELGERLYHLDLKPGNILLDNEMVPKIADFGTSKIFRKELKETTTCPVGTRGYMPPEYIERGEISDKFDIFSLGVTMIEIMYGYHVYRIYAEVPDAKFIKLITNYWRSRLEKTWSGSSLEAYCNQVETCIKIARSCTKKDSHSRPSIKDIIDMLKESEIKVGKLPEIYNKICSTFSSTRLPDQHQNSNLTRGTRRNRLEFVDIQETPSDPSEEFIVGRIEEKNKIIDSLLVSMAEKLTIILPIYGIGGIGKTTFAKLIYNDFKHYSRVWVYVSPVFDLNMIQSSIISQLYEKDSQIDERQEINCRKNILVVLDDLWEVKQLELERLKDILYQGDNRKTVVLVTTRNKIVAERICHNHVPYEIESLTDELCWDIIKQISSFEARHDKVQLTSIGRAIAQKCGGVPLAAKSIGFMLQSKGFDEWKLVKDNDIWNESVSSENTLPTNIVLASLRLSYESMSKSLKLCFTYCAIFPKGHKIVRDDLIHHWLSLGFITATNLLSPKQHCEKYIAHLIGLSFLQHSVLPTKSRAHAKGVALFTMHDLVHDLARLVMGHGIIDGSKQGTVGESSSQYALLTDCSKELISYTSNPENIKALLFLNYGKIDVHGTAFSSAKSLQVLDLSGCSIGELPACIGELVQMRYLKAQNIESEMIPDCFSNLSKLIYLDISGSGISTLPESIGALTDLMYLDISECTRLESLPESFKNLKGLVHLDLSNCWRLHSICDVRDLTNLEYLNLSLEASQLSQLISQETHDQKGTAHYDVQDVIGNLIELRYLGLSHAMEHCDYDIVLRKSVPFPI